jgi:hypothetical protein
MTNDGPVHSGAAISAAAWPHAALGADVAVEIGTGDWMA